MPDIPGGISFQGQVRRVETNNNSKKIHISVDLLEIALEGKENEEYSNLVQVIWDGQRLKDIPDDHISQQFIVHKKRGKQKNIYEELSINQTESGPLIYYNNILVPQEPSRMRLMETAHQAHMSPETMYQQIQKYHCWPSMR